MVPKIGPRMSNVLWASYCDLLKWQLLMPGREEKARGWHSGLRAGDQTPLRRMGLTSCVTRQIMVTGWQALAAQGRLKRRTTSLDIFSPFFFFFFCHCTQIIVNLACLPGEETQPRIPLIRGCRRLGTDFPLRFSERNMPLCILLTQSQMLSGLRL